MDDVLSAIAEESERLQTHPFFELRAVDCSVQKLCQILRGLTFFVFSFQDMVLLNEQRIVDARLREFAGKRRREDAGHSLWFLKDLEVLGVSPDLKWLFGGEHFVTREASYELLSEVCRAKVDGVRIAIPLALEASGTVFFRNMYEFVSAVGLETRFFSRAHWEVETQHESLSIEEEKLLAEYRWAGGMQEEACAVVRRMFGAKARLLSGLENATLLPL